MRQGRRAESRAKNPSDAFYRRSQLQQLRSLSARLQQRQPSTRLTEPQRTGPSRPSFTTFGRTTRNPFPSDTIGPGPAALNVRDNMRPAPTFLFKPLPKQEQLIRGDRSFEQESAERAKEGFRNLDAIIKKLKQVNTFNDPRINRIGKPRHEKHAVVEQTTPDLIPFLHLIPRDVPDAILMPFRTRRRQSSARLPYEHRKDYSP